MLLKMTGTTSLFSEQVHPPLKRGFIIESHSHNDSCKSASLALPKDPAAQSGSYWFVSQSSNLLNMCLMLLKYGDTMWKNKRTAQLTHVIRKDSSLTFLSSEFIGWSSDTALAPKMSCRLIKVGPKLTRTTHYILQKHRKVSMEIQTDRVLSNVA